MLASMWRKRNIPLSIYSNDYVIFFFECDYVVDYIDGFLYIEPSLHPWNEAYLIMVNDYFDVFLDSFGKNFIEYFCIHIDE